MYPKARTGPHPVTPKIRWPAVSQITDHHPSALHETRQPILVCDRLPESSRRSATFGPKGHPVLNLNQQWAVCMNFASRFLIWRYFKWLQNVNSLVSGNKPIQFLDNDHTTDIAKYKQFNSTGPYVATVLHVNASLTCHMPSIAVEGHTLVTCTNM